MAINDYITCCKCDVKLIYDGGKDNNRQWWEERWGKEPEIMCPDCEKKLWENPTMWLNDQPLYFAPRKREWVGLTDEEINNVKHVYDWSAAWTLDDFARVIEAKLKEKNA